VLGTGVLFGALEAGAGAMQREAGIPAVWVIAVQALIILAVLAIDQLRRRRVPTTVGAATPVVGAPTSGGVGD
jgi:simple sugar transport system permease protein